MKKLMLNGFLFIAIIGGVNAQNVASTTTLTSGGNLAGASGTKSAYYGTRSGKFSTGDSNTFTGFNSGSNTGCTLAVCTTTGNFNSFYGSSSGNSNNGGNNNAFFGSDSGASNLTGSNNTYLGYSSGSNNKGSGNVFVGASSGPVSPNQLGAQESNKLFIDNSQSNNPLIYGDFSTDQLKFHGKVGIGGNNATAFGAIPTTVGGISVANYNLFVKGGILTEEIRVGLASTWADYVFAKSYNLKSLKEVEAFIAKNNHLPNVPSAEQVKNEGINVAEMAKIQQEKIEELTLYIIEQNKRIEALEQKMGNK